MRPNNATVITQTCVAHILRSKLNREADVFSRLAALLCAKSVLTRLHHSTSYICSHGAARLSGMFCVGPSLIICAMLSDVNPHYLYLVCPPVMIVSPAKLAEPNETAFGIRTWVKLDWGADDHI